VLWDMQQVSRCKVIVESNSERILKIGQRSSKLCLRVRTTCFLTNGVQTVHLFTKCDRH